MRILYDGLIYSTPHTGGIRRYFTNLISRLPANVEPWVTTTRPPELHFPEHASLHVKRFPRFRPQKLSSICERVFFRGLERRTSFSLAHPTYHFLLTRRRLGDYHCPSIITIHDMISELFPFGGAAGERETARKKMAAADATRVICVSHNTKRDLIELFGTAEEKIRVVYEASELDLSMTQGDEPVPNGPYFLYVGSHAPSYKNFRGVLNGLALVVARHPDVRLCVAGPAFSPDEIATIGSLGLSHHVTHAGRVTDAHLAKLYHRSVSLIYASFYEGFGIPPLEAMACETAVIGTNRSSIPEVVGDAALLVDPNNQEELAAAMISLVEDRSRRDELIRRGREREKQFSWDKMTHEIYEIYQEVAEP